jgi:hypothetical protein
MATHGYTSGHGFVAGTLIIRLERTSVKALLQRILGLFGCDGDRSGHVRTRHEEADIAGADGDTGPIEVLEERNQVLAAEVNDLLEVSYRKLLT